jgi:ATP-dependent Clp protease, protease subunit
MSGDRLPSLPAFSVIRHEAEFTARMARSVPRFDKFQSKRLSNRTSDQRQGRGWYEIKARGDVAEILIYDEIGTYGVSAKQFVQQLAELTAKTIRIRINSPGGDVFDGIAIYNAIVGHEAHIETQIDGVAASAASFIALAGDSVAIAQHAFLMIHKAWAIVLGNADDMRQMANILEKIDGQLADLYAAKSGKSRKQVLEWMAAETWFTADEAREAGFVDVVLGDDNVGPANNRAQNDARRRRLRLAVAEMEGAGPSGERVTMMRRRLELAERTL